MAERPPSVARVVAIASGKGGVGKTTVTAHLATALRAIGLRVGIFDADLYGPNIPDIFGLTSEARGTTWLPVARKSATPYLKPDMRAGFPIVSLGLMVPPARAVAPDPAFIGRLAYQTFRDVQWGELDYLLLDFPPGTGEPQDTLRSRLTIDGVIAVTTASPLAIADAERLVDWAMRDGGRVLGVIENMAYLACPRCGDNIRLFETAIGDSAVLAQHEVLATIPWLGHAAPPSPAAPNNPLAPVATWLTEHMPLG
ncbi:MAG: ATP-binding protein [Chloroflexi bacterium]|nr:ATP-binding protein [Chloroflexota bacterium]